MRTMNGKEEDPAGARAPQKPRRTEDEEDDN